MNYLVSIIIPVYNSEKYIKRCLNSVLNQTYKNIEIVIVDDGSTDNSFLEINKFEDKRIKYFKKENEGVSIARNYGIKKSSGEYLLFVDSDDYIAKDMINELVKRIEGLSEIVFCNNMEIWYNKEEERRLFVSVDKLSKNNVIREIASGRAGLVCSKLVSKKVIEDNNILFDKNLKVGEDQLFFLEVVEKSDEFKHVDKSLYFYNRTNENSVTIKYQHKLYKNFIYLYNQVLKVLERNNMKSKDDNQLLINKLILLTWTAINNEVNGLKENSIRFGLENIEEILKESKSYLNNVYTEDRIGKLIINSSKSKFKLLASLKLIIVIKLFNIKMNIRRKLSYESKSKCNCSNI